MAKVYVRRVGRRLYYSNFAKPREKTYTLCGAGTTPKAAKKDLWKQVK